MGINTAGAGAGDQRGDRRIGRILAALEPEQAAREAPPLVQSLLQSCHDRSVAPTVADDSQALTAAAVNKAAPHLHILLPKLGVGILQRVGMIVAVKLAVDGPPILIDSAADLLGFLQVSDD